MWAFSLLSPGLSGSLGWLTEYNSERPHESLNNLTPEEYRLMAENTEVSKSAWN
ncbi:transposase [Serratia ureilytica]|nr:transposase [Serratia ureilytica]